MATLSITQADTSTDGYLSSADWNTFNDKVSTVFGRAGNVTAQAGDYENFYQPLDSDLTAIAALTTTTYGRSLLTQSDASATRSTLGLGTIVTANTGDFTTSATFTSHTSSTGNGSHIPSGGITNTHVATSAAIDASKLSGVATSAALSTHISNTGNGVHIPIAGITNSEVATGAAIAFSKLSGVQAALSSIGSTVTFNDQVISRYSLETNSQSGTTYTLQASDNGRQVVITNANPITITIPSGLPTGFNCLIVQGGAGVITISPGASVTINNRQSHTKTAGTHAVCSILPTATANVYRFVGDTAS
jgi:hypothetical protein